MLSIQQPLLIFTDLDGTLLDSHSYDWQPAAPWLNREGIHLQNEDPPRVWRTQREGPDGWREGLDHFFTVR
ncbi:hypothetical protein FHD46_03220 [Escherichia coli]|nr:hypothetical protein [Escherichia coli]